jgi:cytochrome c-type biogenesis protein CcmH/NrfG
MNTVMHPRTTPPVAVHQDAFALAARRLSTQRPLRNKRLVQAEEQVDRGELPLARAALEKHLARQPADADALHLLARTSLRMDRRAEAYDTLARCLRIAPDFAAARFNRVNMLVKDWRFEEALEDLRLLARTDACNPLFRQVEANVLGMIGENERSLAICEQLVQENPERCESWLSLGHARRAVGQVAPCIEAYRRAIACLPSCGRAWWSIANLRTERFADEDVVAMQALLQRADVSPEERAACRFALGKALEERGEEALAFEQFDAGNSPARWRSVSDAAALAATLERKKALLTAELFARRREAGAGVTAGDPIFILGRPRSGSTLLEQILASHPDVEGTAELPYVFALSDGIGRYDDPATVDALAALEPAALTRLAQEYLGRARQHRRQGRPFFIDKKPENFHHAGLILLMFPNARIIDARRDPAASCLSLFKGYHVGSAMRLDETGRRYRNYVAQMAHFDRVLPGRIHRVFHEDLLRDPEGEIRRLLAYLGLPFDERCLRFHETKRTVLTPSSQQVRRPINSEGVGLWRRYEPWLVPLLESLGSVQAAYPAVPDDLA